MQKLDAKLQEAKAKVKSMAKAANETNIMLRDTLNAKLRYEKIIAEILQSDNDKSKHARPYSVQEIINNTQADVTVVMKKNKKGLEMVGTSPTGRDKTAATMPSAQHTKVVNSVSAKKPGHKRGASTSITIQKDLTDTSSSTYVKKRGGSAAKKRP